MFQVTFSIKVEISALSPFLNLDALDKCKSYLIWSVPDVSLGNECDGVTEVTVLGTSSKREAQVVTRKCDKDWVIGPDDYLCVKKSKPK